MQRDNLSSRYGAPVSDDETRSLLDRLEPLPPNDYLVSWGSGHRFLFGSPHGWAGADLPIDLCDVLRADEIRVILSASFGTNPDRWQIKCRDRSGNYHIIPGPDTPSEIAKHFKPFPMRGYQCDVQYGADDSFFAWTRGNWVAKGIPKELLEDVKGHTKDDHFDPDNNTAYGKFHRAYPRWITWHKDGSFAVNWIHSDDTPALRMSTFWHLAEKPTTSEWKRFWGDGIWANDRIVQFSMNPHAPRCDIYSIFRCCHEGEIDCYVRTGDGREHCRVSLPHALEKAALSVPEPKTGFRKARARRSGKPHQGDCWELEMTKGETLSIVSFPGNSWFVVRNEHGNCGYAHISWLDFIDEQPTVYTFYQGQTETWLAYDKIEFPLFAHLLPDANICRLDACRQVKTDPDGPDICVHELESILKTRGDELSKSFVKKERDKWKPASIGKKGFANDEVRNSITQKAVKLVDLHQQLAAATPAQNVEST